MKAPQDFIKDKIFFLGNIYYFKKTVKTSQKTLFQSLVHPNKIKYIEVGFIEELFQA
jgi:hypothetical protein